MQINEWPVVRARRQRIAAGRESTIMSGSTKGNLMSEHTYRVTEIVGSSPDGVDQAIRNGVKRASQTLHNLDWFEVTEIRGHLENGEVGHVQVTMKVGFRLDET
jgi:flavin-binding protein dodecin